MEFTFGMIVCVLLILGTIYVFAWTGRELVGRTQAHENMLTFDYISPGPNHCTGGACPLRQVRPSFYRGASINAAVNSNIFGQQ